MSIWDDPDLAVTDNFLRLDAEGDSFEGEISSLGTRTWDDGSKCPELGLVLPDGTEATWTAGQTQAKRKLAELRPEIGDYIRVLYQRQERRAGGKTLKHIDIQLDRGGRAVTAATPSSGFATGGAAVGATADAGPGGAPAGVDPAAWSTLDRSTQVEVLAKMGLAPTTAGASSAEPPF